MSRAQISSSTTHTRSVSMPPGHPSGTHLVPPILDTAAVITARDICSTSRLASRRSWTGWISLGTTGRRLSGLPLRLSGVERESACEFCMAPANVMVYDSYWSTTPTGPQWVGMQITSFTHGSTGTSQQLHFVWDKYSYLSRYHVLPIPEQCDKT